MHFSNDDQTAQFRDLFGSSRVPKSRERDTIASYVNTNHVAVMCCNQLFYFQALWPDTGDVAVDEGDLENILEAIQTHASNPDSKDNKNSEEQKYLRSISALGVLTSLPRNQWARARDEMIDYSQKNAESFRVIDSALFVLVLDDFIPQNKKEAAANMLHGSYSLAEYKSEKDSSTTEFQCGSCTNRWYDKLQVSINLRYENTRQCREFYVRKSANFFILVLFQKGNCDRRRGCRNQF